MGWIILKYLTTAGLVVLISEVAKRSDKLGALIAALPMVTSKDDSLNVKGAYLEVWSDMLGSVGVIVGALLIRWTGWGWIDSVIAVGIGLWVLPRAWALLKQSTHILLEGTPEHLNIDEIKQALSSHWGVDSIHDLHVCVLGTLITDHLTDNLGMPLMASTAAFSLALALVFALWHRREGTPAILVTFALGTASGDWFAEGLKLGYANSTLVFGALIAIARFRFA
eukprot:gene9968-9774_t